MRFFLFILISFVSGLVRADPTIVWMRPVSNGLHVDGFRIVSGSEYELMRYLANHLPDWKHEYESFPVKRSWEFIKSNSTAERLYCFYGASQTKEREKWAIFSEPTSILLPYPVVAKKGELDQFVVDGFVSVQSLRAQEKTTALFDGVVNSWSRVVNMAYAKSDLVLRLNPGNEASASLTTRLIKANRIDFGFVGSGDEEIRMLEQQFDVKFSLYQLRELAEDIRKGNRIMCSKSALGTQAIADIDSKLQIILKDTKNSEAFRELNFNVIGYHPNLKSNFNKHWERMYQSGQ